MNRIGMIEWAGLTPENVGQLISADLYMQMIWAFQLLYSFFCFVFTSQFGVSWRKQTQFVLHSIYSLVGNKVSWTFCDIKLWERQLKLSLIWCKRNLAYFFGGVFT